MKTLFASAMLAFALLLTGCGGGGDSAGSTSVSVAPAPASPTTLLITDTTTGTGTVAAAGNTLTVHYTGWLYSATTANFKGSQFDSSVGKTPFTFRLGVGQVILGWDQGLVGMRVGGKRTLVIPSSLAYGASGISGLIPPNTALVFDVELLAVQ